MKNSTNQGMDQHYNVQVAVDQESLLIVAPALSNHPNDKQEAESTFDALSPKLGKPKAAALDNGYFSAANVKPWKIVMWILTSLRVVSRIIKIGIPSFRNSLNRLRKMPARKSKWPTNFKLKLVGPFIVCASAPSNGHRSH